MDKNRRTNILISLFSCALILCIWALLSASISSSIILPSPSEVFFAFIRIIKTPSFLSSVFSTVLRALLSFTIIVLSGAVLGTLAGFFPSFSSFMKPAVSILKATPVMSVILIAFFWMKTGSVPVFSAFLMGFPVMFVQSSRGVKTLDPALDQVCTVYEIKGFDKFRHYIFPSMLPSYVTGAGQSLSMVWKVVIAAEVLTVPSSGVGRSLSLSQVQLQTDNVMAWTVTAVLLTALGDALFSLALKKLSKRRSL